MVKLHEILVFLWSKLDVLYGPWLSTYLSRELSSIVSYVLLNRQIVSQTELIVWWAG